MVAYLLSILFIIYIGYLAVPGSSLFSWHPFLMTLGYVGFLFQAVLVFSKESSFFVSYKHKTKQTIHWVLNTLGLVCILTAYACIYINKETNNKPHLTSWHGLIGFITILYTVTQWFAGHGLTLFIDKIRHLIPYSKLSVYHSTSGVFLYVLATASICLGFMSNWFSSLNSNYLKYFCFVMVSILALILTNQVTSKFTQRRAAAATTHQSTSSTSGTNKTKSGKQSK